MHRWGLLQLLVIINYIVLFIEYAYQTLVVNPYMLYRYHPILLLYSVILLLHCIVCYYTLHIVPIYLIIVMILPLMGP